MRPSLVATLVIALLACSCTRRARIVETEVVVPVTSGGGVTVVEATAPASVPSDATGPGPSTSIASASCPPPPSFALAGCRYQCEVEPRSGTSSCRGAVSTLETGAGAMTLSADLRGAHALLAQVEACEPEGWMLHIADSRTSNGWSGDAGSSSNDAELHLNGSAQGASTFVYSSDERPPGQDPLVATDTSTYTGSSCAVRTFYVADSHVAIDDGFSVCSPSLLRVDPPVDHEGAPDATFWIGVHRTVDDPGRSGSGIRRVTFCVQ